jgi:hypothetical protein
MRINKIADKRIVLAAILIFATIIRIVSMLRKGMSGDECLFFIRTYTQHPPIGTGLYHIFNNISLYLNIDPRFFTIIIGIAGIFLAYRIGKDIKDSWFGLLLAFIISITPAHIYVTSSGYLDNFVLLFILALVYLYIRLEVTERAANRNAYIIAISLIIFVGTFIKMQAFVFLAGPLFLYGLVKHRLKIFKQELYWAIGISILPVLVYLVANPEMASTILLFFYEAYKKTILERLVSYLQSAYYLDGIFFALFFACAAVMFAKYRSLEPKLKRACVFFAAYAVFFMFFMIKSNPRYYYMIYTSIPIAFFISAAIASIGKSKVNHKISRTFQTMVVLILVLFTINSTFDILPFYRSGWMDATYQEAKTNPFYNHHAEINAFFEDEKNILVGGNMGMDARFYIHKRLMWPSVINSPEYDGINKGIIVYPIDKNYMGNPAWDYEYVAHILKNSKVVKEFNDSEGNPVVLIEIINHTGYNYSDTENKGLNALGYLDGVV